MDAIEFFKSAALQLPLQRGEDDYDLVNYLDRVFSRYLAEFDNLDSKSLLTRNLREQKSKAERLASDVTEVVRKYLQGFPDMAYSALEEAIDGVGHLDRLRPDQNVAGYAQLKELYRVRVEKPNEEPRGMWFKRRDLFHIPFEKRHLVTRQRYSIPGLPCLYLGSTLLVCWEELGRPPFHSMYVSRFSTTQNATVTLLDFSTPPSESARFIEQFPSTVNDPVNAPFVFSRAICWPLIAACSVRRLHRDAPFIAEYIAPQLMLRWVASPSKRDGKRRDGIVYFCVNAEPFPNSDTALLNYVFPVQTLQPQGHCPVLKANFELSEPVSWQLLESSHLPEAKTAHQDIHIPIVKGATAPYQQTSFGIVESRLAKLPREPLP